MLPGHKVYRVYISQFIQKSISVFLSRDKMEKKNFKCTTCSLLCREAVESTCCGCLFCATCPLDLAACPECHKSPFNVSANRFARKAIECLAMKSEVACPECHAQIQRGKMEDHKKWHVSLYQDKDKWLISDYK